MKRLPTWAVYLADILCIASALLIAATYYSIGLPMETAVVLLCALMVVAAAAMICTAQLMHFKYTKLAKEKSEIKQASNIEENFQILFKQVSAIKRDNSTLNSNFTALLNRYNELAKSKDGDAESKETLAKFHALTAKIEELDGKFAKDSDLASLKLETEESIENFKADVELDLGKLDDIDNAVKELKNILEDIGSQSQEAEQAEEEVIEEVAEELEEAEEVEEPAQVEEAEEEAEESSLEEVVEVEAEDLDEDLEADEDEYDENDIDFDEDEDYSSLDDDGVDPSDDLSQISLMSRALNNTQQSHSILGSFAKIDNKAQKPAEEAPAPTSDDFVDIEDDFQDLDDDLSDILNLANEEEASITINSMLGLGNKPYIRGNAEGLSQSEGVQMDFLEIGKWRYIFTDLKEQANISIWLNDEIISKEGEISIKQNEQKEININF